MWILYLGLTGLPKDTYMQLAQYMDANVRATVYMKAAEVWHIEEPAASQFFRIGFDLWCNYGTCYYMWVKE
jgi:hypothetical protein